MSLLVLVVALLCAPWPARGEAPTRPEDVPTLHPPVPGPVTVGFDLPEPRGPGHRGLDLATRSGDPVDSPVAGRVHFAGSVAGRRWVTVAAASRVLVTVGPLADVVVSSGDVVVEGSLLGHALGRHDGRAALHLSVRVDGAYVDPGPHLGRPPLRATLLPVASGPVRAGTGLVGGVPTSAAAVPWSRLR